MRLLLRLIVLLVLLTPVAMLGLAWLALSDDPLLVETRALESQDVARARTILEQNDPRRLPSGATRRILLNERDLNLAANYLLHGYGAGAARVALHPNRMEVAATIRLPGMGMRPFLNVRTNLNASASGPELQDLVVGSIAVPDSLAHWLSDHLLSRALGDLEYREAYDALEGFEIRGGKLAITYRWRPELLATVRQGLLPPAQRAAVAAYQDRLHELHADGIGTRGSLTDILPPLFAFAAERSRTGNPVDENRALLLVLGGWASGRRLDALMPAATASRPLPRPFRLTLDRRYDSAQHFLISAAIAANGDRALANAVGLYKELSDIDRGSGFSFTDLAADRAGTRFGEHAVRSAASARSLQQRLSARVRESDLAPSFRDLPEHLTVAEFTARYGAVDSPEYRAVIADIERRLDAVPLLRD